MRRLALTAPVLALAVLSHAAHAEPWVFKYDEFADGLSQAAGQVDGGQFYTQPGFVRGEAFGQIYRPPAEMFPLQISGFDMILAAPPNASGTLYTNATIEIYQSDSKTPDPGEEPIFSVSTAELFNPTTQDLGFPLQGNAGISVEFDLSEEENRPPVLDISGGANIWLMVRFDSDAASLSSEWGTLSCFQVEGLICGCQNVGTVHDSDITPKTNVIHHVAPIGACSGPTKAWTYMENVPSTESGFNIDGDVILRLRADVAAAPCVAECDGVQCGDDGCGGACGTCGQDLFCVGGAVDCQPDCLSKQCGDNGCGGTCGTCGGDQACGDDFFCHDECSPNCDGRVCGDDGCGGSCGACQGALFCTAAGRCEADCEPACDGKTCGPDGCGGACGTCDAGVPCVGGVCDAPCESDCSGKECGLDACGGICGVCDVSEDCNAGVCEKRPPVFAVTDVSPDNAFAMVQTQISITGSGFVAGAAVKVGATDCSGVSVTGDGLISATVPGLAVGTYSVIVVNPDDAIATLPDAFTVNPVDTVEPVGGDSDDGCAGAGGPFYMIVALAFARALLRRRSARGDSTTGPRSARASG